MFNNVAEKMKDPVSLQASILRNVDRKTDSERKNISIQSNVKSNPYRFNQ